MATESARSHSVKIDEYASESTTGQSVTRRGEYAKESTRDHSSSSSRRGGDSRREQNQGGADDSNFCGTVLTAISWLLICLTFPFSLCLCIKVVQEYERAVIFRLGRLLPGGAKGPGLFFVIPCTDYCRRIDLRTVSYNVPPQEKNEFLCMTPFGVNGCERN